MYLFITILVILIGILLGAIVLIQNPKGGGLSGSFGGVGQQLLGARRSTDIIEKLTWGFAAGLLFFCLSTAFFVDKTSKVEIRKSEVEKQNQSAPFTPAAPAPTTTPAPAGGQAPAGGTGN